MHNFSCPICAEAFYISIQDGIEANKEVFLRVVHDHTDEDEPPVWRAVIHEKGARNVEDRDEVMRLAYAQGKARRDVIQKKAKESAKKVKKERLTRNEGEFYTGSDDDFRGQGA